MRRREFIGLISAAVSNFSRPGNAQIGTGLPVVGFLVPFKEDADFTKERIAAVRKGLLESGFIEGKNYFLAMRFANGDLERWPSLAKELADIHPRVVVLGAYLSRNVQTYLPEVPLVFTAIAVDPIKSGMAESYARPGGRFTGNVMNAVGGEETMTQKRIGFFKQIVPNLERLGMIAPVAPLATSLTSSEKEALQKAAAQFGFEFVHYGFSTLEDLEGAFASGRRDDVSAFYISGEPVLSSNISRVMALVAASGKPTVGVYPTWARSGILMSYSTDPNDGFRRAGVYAAKILSGDKPGDLPIEQASKFTLVINQKAAMALGIVVPASLLALADEVIE
jgi:putative ABC transport system substrate-binding protein